MCIQTQTLHLFVYLGFRCTKSHVAWWWHATVRSQGTAGGTKPTAWQHGQGDDWQHQSNQQDGETIDARIPSRLQARSCCARHCTKHGCWPQELASQARTGAVRGDCHFCHQPCPHVQCRSVGPSKVHVYMTSVLCACTSFTAAYVFSHVDV